MTKEEHKLMVAMFAEQMIALEVVVEHLQSRGLIDRNQVRIRASEMQAGPELDALLQLARSRYKTLGTIQGTSGLEDL